MDGWRLVLIGIWGSRGVEKERGEGGELATLYCA